MQIVVPEILTSRIRLRAPCASDISAYASFFADAEASHFYGGPLRLDQAWRKLAGDIGHWALRGYGVWVIETIDARQFVGGCGLVWPDGWPRPELTWWIVRDARRQGLAAEASATVIAWGRANGWDQIETHMKDENDAARGLVAKLGGVRIAREVFPDGAKRDVFSFP